MQLLYHVYFMQHLRGEAIYALAEIDYLQSVLDKAKCWKLICNEYNVVDVFDKCDRTLFKSSLCLSHSLNHLFPWQATSYASYVVKTTETWFLVTST